MNKRGPKPGNGGRPKGPVKVRVSGRVLPQTLAKILATGPVGEILDTWAAKEETL